MNNFVSVVRFAGRAECQQDSLGFPVLMVLPPGSGEIPSASSVCGNKVSLYQRNTAHHRRREVAYCLPDSVGPRGPKGKTLCLMYHHSERRSIKLVMHSSAKHSKLRE